MDASILIVHVSASCGMLPVADAHVKVSDANGKFLYDAKFNSNGSKDLEIDASYSVVNLDISALGFYNEHIGGVQIDAGRTVVLHVQLTPAIEDAKLNTDLQIVSSTVWPPFPGVSLRRGMQGPSIRQVQERLNELGANPRLAEDGIFGPLTEAAVITFQRSNGLIPDGVVGPITWNELFIRQPVQPPPPVWPQYPGILQRRGMQGPSVFQIQDQLNLFGANPRLVTDGVFGPLTEAAVIAFQREHGLVPDGVVGPITWNALFASLPGPYQKTIVIDPGHGGFDLGEVFGVQRESDETLKLSLAVQRLLQEKGQRVILTRNADVFVSFDERRDISNRNNADLFVSIHRNASSNPAVHGVENLVFTSADDNNVLYAFDVLDEVVRAGVQDNRGVFRSYQPLLEGINAPSMMLEIGFITNARDNQLFDQNFYAYADAIARGIMNALNNGGEQQQPFFFYDVVSGDNLWALGQRFGTTQDAIMQLNNLSNNTIFVRQVLKIPTNRMLAPERLPGTHERNSELIALLFILQVVKHQHRC